MRNKGIFQLLKGKKRNGHQRKRDQRRNKEKKGKNSGHRRECYGLLNKFIDFRIWVRLASLCEWQMPLTHQLAHLFRHKPSKLSGLSLANRIYFGFLFSFASHQRAGGKKALSEQSEGTFIFGFYHLNIIGWMWNMFISFSSVSLGPFSLFLRRRWMLTGSFYNNENELNFI